MSALISRGYDRLPGEFGLLNPIPQPADEIISSLCARYAGCAPEQRALMRASLTADDFYSLIDFASRCAVFSLRRNEPNLILQGLTALAMVEHERIDCRDFDFSHLIAAASTLGLDAGALLKDAAAMADPETARILAHDGIRGWVSLRFLTRTALQTLVSTKFGAGFISPLGPLSTDFHKMLQTGIAIAQSLEHDGRYVVRLISPESEAPDIWFENPSAKERLREARATLTIQADLSEKAVVDIPEEHRSAAWLNVWLMNFPDGAPPEELAVMAASADVEGGAVTAIAKGSHLALIVARTSIEGGEALESNESLAALAGRLYPAVPLS